MNGNNLVHAFTNPGIDAPPYINITRMNDGSVRVIVRGVGTEEITMSEADWRSLAWSVFAETNDREKQPLLAISPAGLAAARAARGPSAEGDYAEEMIHAYRAHCQRCQGTGEIITDWDRYQEPADGDKGDEAVAECPDCDGDGKSQTTALQVAAPALLAALSRIVKDWDGEPEDMLEAIEAIDLATPTAANATEGDGWKLVDFLDAAKAIVKCDDDARAARGKPDANLNGYGLVDLFDVVDHPFGAGEHKQQPYRSNHLDVALTDLRAMLAAAPASPDTKEQGRG